MLMAKARTEITPYILHCGNTYICYNFLWQGLEPSFSVVLEGHYILLFYIRIEFKKS